MILDRRIWTCRWIGSRSCKPGLHHQLCLGPFRKRLAFACPGDDDLAIHSNPSSQLHDEYYAGLGT